jgi:hypothetical protein
VHLRFLVWTIANSEHTNVFIFEFNFVMLRIGCDWIVQLYVCFLIGWPYVGRISRNLLTQRDVMQPLNLVDKKSGIDYFTAATRLVCAGGLSGFEGPHAVPVEMKKEALKLFLERIIEEPVHPRWRFKAPPRSTSEMSDGWARPRTRDV